jgi:23S rRNA pseudouridine2457 synthase
VLLAFYKPFGVLSQFTPDVSSYSTLAGFGFPPAVYPVGRLDADSEGLLLLSDEPQWNARLLGPKQGHPREYWVQVEGGPAETDLARLRSGVPIQGRKTLPCEVRRLESAPRLPPRVPPIRYRASIPDTWLSIVLVEGRNRQVRRMTAAIGCPTLRLVRVRIGGLWLGELEVGKWRELGREERQSVLGGRASL